MSILMRNHDHLDYDDDDGHGVRWGLIGLAMVVIVLLGLGAAALWVQRQIDPPGSAGPEVTVEIVEGMAVDDIATLLDREGVIASARVFRWYTRLKGSPTVQAGEYQLNQSEAMGTVLDVLARGPRVELQTLTIPEGLTLEQIAAVVGEMPGRSAERFLELARGGTVRSQFQPADIDDLAGLVLPETYFVDADDDEEAILRRLVREFDVLVTSLGITAAADRLGLTPYEIMVTASLVEREARVPQDRGPIARVIYNRLEGGIPLQIDATVQFALGVQKPRLLFSDLEIDSPYNTYKYPGLPPGPIAAPGRASLEAAISPPAGTWLYFVLGDPDGSHVFADTLAEHNRNVAESKRKGLL